VISKVTIIESYDSGDEKSTFTSEQIYLAIRLCRDGFSNTASPLAMCTCLVSHPVLLWVMLLVFLDLILLLHP
jgi:hypothetical protein